MPYCINNNKKTYTGNEPSPKGLGYCASGEKEGTKMKGKDGNMWIKSNGKWIKNKTTLVDKSKTTLVDKSKTTLVDKSKTNCENIVKYYKIHKLKSGHKYTTFIFGKEINGKFYKWKSYNKFSNKSSPIEEGYKKGKINKDYINTYICGNKKTDKDLDKNIHKNYKTYFIHDNGSQPFLVAIKNKIAKIFKIDKNIEKKDNPPEYYYNQLIKEYKFNKIFIPKGYDAIDIFNNIIKDYKEYQGNSILLETKDNYVYIGTEIYEFNIDDEVINYYSPIGNNDVPYPIAIGKENVYFMLDKKYVELSYFTNFTKIDFINAYGHYYGKLKKYSKNIKNIKNLNQK